MAAEPPLTWRASQYVSHRPAFARIHSPNSKAEPEDSGVVAEQAGSTRLMDRHLIYQRQAFEIHILILQRLFCSPASISLHQESSKSTYMVILTTEIRLCHTLYNFILYKTVFWFFFKLGHSLPYETPFINNFDSIWESYVTLAPGWTL